MDEEIMGMFFGRGRTKRDFEKLPKGWSYDLSIKDLEVDIKIDQPRITDDVLAKEMRAIVAQGRKLRNASLPPIEGQFAVVGSAMTGRRKR
jgi:hypothetical protein